jgi:hypothetical protein
MMKEKMKTGTGLVLVVFALLQFALRLNAQETQQIYYNRIEPVKLELSKYPHGNIQWQRSEDEGVSWTDLPAETGISMGYSENTSGLVRAVVLSGTCDTVFSQTTELTVIELRTDEAVDRTSSSATIRCYLDSLDVRVKESGLLFSEGSTVDMHSQKLSHDGLDEGFFQVPVEGLTAGKSYRARAYVVSEDDHWIYGNILEFSPIKVSLQERVNIWQDSLQMLYRVVGVPADQVVQHGIVINAVPGSGDTVNAVPGILEGETFRATARSLDPAADLYIMAYCEIDGTWFYSEEKKVRTWSAYSGEADNTPFTIAHKIVWDDPSTARKLTPEGTFGEYGRVTRLGDTDTLLLVYQGGPNNGDWIDIYLRQSYDNGETWEDQETLMDLDDYPGQYWRFCTPEINFLQNGWIMVMFEANARPDENQSSVQLLVSKDSARTWSDPYIYITGRTWEPSMVQLPGGELELFYSSEAKWWPDGPIYQDIQLIRSTDNGETWSEPEIVAYFPAKRDGMPVPLLLQGNKGVIFTIETVNSGVSPYMIHREMDGPWVLTNSNFEDSEYRWLAEGFSGHGGAPYLIQLPTGETVLSAHIYRGGDWHQNNYQQVMVGDNEAREFESLTNPWGELPWGEGAVNNSLFLKDDTTVVTISSRMFSDGSGGVYWLEGSVVPK